MAYNDSTVSVKNSEEHNMQQPSVAEQLADAQKEILDLKMKIMWMERNYE
ncbi:hypothetical protein [Alteromonas gracilis]